VERRRGKERVISDISITFDFNIVREFGKSQLLADTHPGFADMK
jgi:hypothetical protein